MTEPYQICHCGHPKDTHHFRHPYKDVTPVTFNAEKQCYEIVASEFPEQTSTKCAVPNCDGLRGLHQTTLIEHAYQPVVTKYRQLNFCVLPGTICSMCNTAYSMHKRGTDLHPFTMRLYVTGMEKQDKVRGMDDEEDEVRVEVLNKFD